MKRLWVAIAVIGVALFFVFMYMSALTYHNQMVQTSAHEVVTYGSIVALGVYVLLAFISIAIAFFAGYKILKGD
jgi:hypothetical protein